MQLIDTHTHLYMPDYAPDETPDAVTRALQAGVVHMILPGVDVAAIEPMRALHARYPRVTSMCMGLHPTEVKESWRDDLAAILAELEAHPSDYVAVGEIGMDLYWDKTFREQQMQVLEAQLNVAVERRLPINIHCREGLDEFLEVLDGLEVKPAGAFHSFGGDARDVERIRNRGDYYFGINGIVTFKNSSLRHTLHDITPSRILLETDAPFLAPVPLRGKRNESAYMVHTAAFAANELGIPLEQFADITTANARQLFNLPS